ncbi:polyprenyl synthetase family protein [Streptomyces sp. NBC_00015]|uniref:polyprenyl synthetase family protein n=1 Tax=Streptomyces sp. NBC_00015 TaxID=2903611 RepID=UPI003252EF89
MRWTAPNSTRRSRSSSTATTRTLLPTTCSAGLPADDPGCGQGRRCPHPRRYGRGSLTALLPTVVACKATRTGSPLHDDIIDRDAPRRERPSAHAVFGQEMSIDAGNALFFTWCATAAECRPARCPPSRRHPGYGTGGRRSRPRGNAPWP